MLEVVVNNQPVSMELDTGSAVTLVSVHTFKSKWPDTPLQVSNVKLRTCSNESSQVLGGQNSVQQTDSSASSDSCGRQWPKFIWKRLACTHTA